MFPAPPHWATRRPPARRAPTQRGEQRVVVGDPVERRGREDDVDGVAAEVEPDEVRDAEVDVGAEALLRAASIIDGRQVDADHAAVRGRARSAAR